MTGFGSAAEQIDGIHYAVELRSLNNRYFKANIRLPDELSSLEAELETLLRKHVSRGAVTLIVKYRVASTASTHEINDHALLNYLQHLESLKNKLADSDHSINIDLTALLAMPGVLRPLDDADTLLTRAKPAVLKLTTTACQAMTAMRGVEGLATAQELSRHCQVIRDRVEAIAQRAPVVIDEYHARLQARVSELLARNEMNLNDRDLMREVAIYAERSDICEELARIAGHLEQFEQLLDAPDDEPAGRTMEFVNQELLREANTIASKSIDAQISKAIVEVKGAIDRLKEQCQNVE